MLEVERTQEPSELVAARAQDIQMMMPQLLPLLHSASTET